MKSLKNKNVRVKLYVDEAKLMRVCSNLLTQPNGTLLPIVMLRFDTQFGITFRLIPLNFMNYPVSITGYPDVIYIEKTSVMIKRCVRCDSKVWDSNCLNCYMDFNEQILNKVYKEANNKINKILINETTKNKKGVTI